MKKVPARSEKCPHFTTCHCQDVDKILHYSVQWYVRKYWWKYLLDKVNTMKVTSRGGCSYINYHKYLETTEYESWIILTW